MAGQNTPAAEAEISPALVNRLLAQQNPALAGLPIALLAHGWDNVTFRLGSELVVRLPRRELAAGLIANEARWLPSLAPRLPLATPVPVFHGHPAEGYPWEWLIAPLLPGQPASTASEVDFATCARQLGEFFAALHQPAPEQAPVNPFRGGSLADRDRSTQERIEMLAGEADTHALDEIWERALSTQRHHGPALWLHGDAHAGNLLVLEGAISGVIDFGDITAGDPATDLAIAWIFLPAEHRGAFWSSYGVTGPDLVMRSRGWALSLGTAYVTHSADNPEMRAMGERTLEAVLDRI